MPYAKTPFFSFEARIDRSTYAIAAIVIEVLDQGIGQIGSIGATSLHFTFAKGDVWPFLQTVVVPAPLAWVMFVGTIAAFVAIGLASLGFEVRRFHDFAWSGWCVLLNIPLACIPFPDTPGVIPELRRSFGSR